MQIIFFWWWWLCINGNPFINKKTYYINERLCIDGEDDIYIDDEGAVYELMGGSSLLMEECTLMDSYKIFDGRIYINGCL